MDEDSRAPLSPIINLHSHPLARKKPPPEQFGSRLVLASSLAERQRRPKEFIVDGLIPKREVTLLAGPAGLGKTHLCQMMMTACAFGRPWFGYPTRLCRSFGLLGEDKIDDLHERWERICDHYEGSLFDFEQMVTFIPKDHQDLLLYEFKNRWVNTGNPHFRWQQLSHEIKERGIELVVLDNVGVIYGGEYFNRHQVRDFIRFFDGQADIMNIAIVILIHPPKDLSSYFAGLQTWEDAARHTVALFPANLEDKDANEFVFRARKSNIIDRDHPMKTTGIPMRWDRGMLVKREVEILGNSLIDKLDLDAKVLAAAQRGMELGWKLAADPGSPSYLPRRLMKQQAWTAAGIRFPQLVASVDRLVRDEKLVLVAVQKQWFLRPADGPRYLGEVAE